MSQIQEPFSTMDNIGAATQFINSTSSHIFLTGKAGTGKTTFLKNLFSCTHKQFVVVAPTGIAALNAGGVTIHSQFLLPFGMFIPGNHLSDDFSQGNFYTANILARKHPLNSIRKQVLRSIDLLVIDEVSMLRADLLDAIDYRMKAARGNFSQSFGGVQLLLIGDLYQLPPVIKREEENYLQRHYNSGWFFESKALKQDNFVYVELDKIFRQQDDGFIALLNNLRNNKITEEDIDQLNKYYKSPEEIRLLSQVVTLTTHNYKADELNLRALKELETTPHVFHARIGGNFPESMFPVQERLELKVGAQIMFIKNDNEEKLYFNGKLATVTEISGGEITVAMADTSAPYILNKAVWENKRYTVNDANQELDDEVIGTFEQYPIKLAWAITVHKSQGLTFDRAIIDVGQAFADGQVYVALSRLRSLDGLVMRTRIEAKAISTDSQIVTFTQANNQPEALASIMKSKQLEYIRQLVNITFDFENLLREMTYVQRGDKDTEPLGEKSTTVIKALSNVLLTERENTTKFRRQLCLLLDANNQDQLIERLKRGSEYYKNIVQQQVAILLHHIAEMQQRKKMKMYLNSLADLDQLFCKKMEEIDKVVYIAESILFDRQKYDFKNLSEQRALSRAKVMAEVQSKLGTPPAQKKKKKKNRKGEPSTYDVTLGMLDSGMSIALIAKERGLTTGTIESHLAKAVAENRIPIGKFVCEEDVTCIEDAIKELPADFTSKDLFIKLEGKFSYNKLRAVLGNTKIPVQ